MLFCLIDTIFGVGCEVVGYVCLYASMNWRSFSPMLKDTLVCFSITITGKLLLVNWKEEKLIL